MGPPQCRVSPRPCRGPLAAAPRWRSAGGSCCARRDAVAHGADVTRADELIVITKPGRPNLWRAGVDLLARHVIDIKDQVFCNYEHLNQRRAKLSHAYILTMNLWATILTGGLSPVQQPRCSFNGLESGGKGRFWRSCSTKASTVAVSKQISIDKSEPAFCLA